MTRPISPRHPSVAGRLPVAMPTEPYPSLAETKRLWRELVVQLELDEIFAKLPEEE